MRINGIVAAGVTNWSDTSLTVTAPATATSGPVTVVTNGTASNVTQVLTVEGGTGVDEIVYYHTDALGSVRMITDATGGVVARYDYLPFGQPYPSDLDAEARRFGQLERTPETGNQSAWAPLDYAQARYYHSQTARFTSPDLPGVDQKLSNPQSWNLYNARNNPVRYIDPSGRKCENVYNDESGAFCSGVTAIRIQFTETVLGGHQQAPPRRVRLANRFQFQGSRPPAPVRRRLNTCEKDTLSPYIPAKDRNRAWLNIDQVPDIPFRRDHLHTNFRAIALGNEIYMFPNEYNPRTPNGLALLGHELVHVGQWRKGLFGGLNLFTLPFYRRFDKVAEEVEERIRVELSMSDFSGC